MQAQKQECELRQVWHPHPQSGGVKGGGTAIHEGEWLHLASVEGAHHVPVEDVLLQLGEVVFGGSTG